MQAAEYGSHYAMEARGRASLRAVAAALAVLRVPIFPVIVVLAGVTGLLAWRWGIVGAVLYMAISYMQSVR